MTNTRNYVLHDLGKGEGVSNCCGAEMYADYDICPDCKEHCDTEIDCSACDGQGITKFLIIFTRTCKKCQGEGWVTLES